MLIIGVAIILLILALPAGAVSWAYASNWRNVRTARQRLAGTSRLIDTAFGPIEYAVIGDGPAILISHGAGGGFDQGLLLGEPLVEKGFRIIAPSRFGYLRSPPVAHPSAAAQADAYAQLLDALGITRAAILGASAGGPAAIEFAIRHPKKCAALILLVPLTYTPRDGSASARRLSPWAEKILMAIVSSDLVFAIASTFARGLVIRTVLGPPPKLVAAASADEQARIMRIMEMIQPISRRASGIASDSHISAGLTPFALDRISAPTLVMSARDDGYGTYPGAEYTATKIAHARFVGVDGGGHMLVGHQQIMIEEVLRLLDSASGTSTTNLPRRQFVDADETANIAVQPCTNLTGQGGNRTYPDAVSVLDKCPLTHSPGKALERTGVT
jgi:pimeloyl-ACP methyl ester carboxylesterase